MDSGVEQKYIAAEANCNSALVAERMEHPQSFVAREGEVTKTLAECMVAAKQRITNELRVGIPTYMYVHSSLSIANGDGELHG